MYNIQILICQFHAGGSHYRACEGRLNSFNPQVSHFQMTWNTFHFETLFTLKHACVLLGVLIRTGPTSAQLPVDRFTPYSQADVKNHRNWQQTSNNRPISWLAIGNNNKHKQANRQAASPLHKLSVLGLSSLIAEFATWDLYKENVKKSVLVCVNFNSNFPYWCQDSFSVYFQVLYFDVERSAMSIFRDRGHLFI